MATPGTVPVLGIEGLGTRGYAVHSLTFFSFLSVGRFIAFNRIGLIRVHFVRVLQTM